MGSRYLLPLLFLAGILVYFPSLRCGYLLDDYLHASMIHGTFPAERSPFDLYDFVNDADRPALFARGMLPWWSDPHLKLRFFRPLSSALIWAEHRLLGDGPILLHAHSFLWWCAMVIAARALFQRLLAPRAALLATVVFAFAPCHALPIAWIANREALISLTFGLLGLGALLRFRDASRRLGASLGQAEPRPQTPARTRDVLLATLFFGAAMLGGEYALCTGGYVLALWISSPGASLRVRAVGIATFALPAAVYLAVRAKLGYGTAGSSFYVDPLHDPRDFFAYAPRGITTLLADAWLSLDGITLTASTPFWLLALIVAAGAVLLAVIIRRAFAGLDDAPRRDAAWLCAGSFLALAPVLAVVPSPRLLGATLFGVAAVIAIVLDHAWYPRPSSRPSEAGGLVALALGFAHLVHGPGTAWLTGRYYQRSSDAFEQSSAAITARVGDTKSAQMFIVRGSERSFFLAFALDPTFTSPARWRLLANTGHVLAIRRGPRTLDLIAPAGGALYPPDRSDLFRHERDRIPAGRVVALPGMTATVLDASALGARVVRFETDRDLEELSFLAEQSGGFTVVDPPGEGFGKPFDP